MGKHSRSEDKPDGYSLGNRTQRPHSPKGWNPQRESEEQSSESMPPRGTVQYGEHDRPKKN